MGSVALLRPAPAPFPGTRCTRGWGWPHCCTEPHQARQAHCAITKIYYFSPHQHLDQSHNNNTYRDGWWWEPFGTSFFIYFPQKVFTLVAMQWQQDSRNLSSWLLCKEMFDPRIQLFCLWKSKPVLVVNIWDAEEAIRPCVTSDQSPLAISAITRRLGQDGLVSRSLLLTLAPMSLVVTTTTTQN